MSVFKNGDWVSLVGLDELTKQALMARFVADGYDRLYLRENSSELGISGGCLFQSLLPQSKVRQLPPEEVLFIEAPDGATKVVKFYNGDFGWIGGCIGSVTFSRYLLSGLTAKNTVVLEKGQQVGWPSDPSALPPVGEECLAYHHCRAEYFRVIVLAHYGGGVVYKPLEGPNKDLIFEAEQYKVTGNFKFIPLPEVKYIDMSLFKDSDIWVEGGPADNYLRDKAKNFHPSCLKDADPIFDEWNTWIGDEKPAWLEGFEFEVIETHTTAYCGKLQSDSFQVREEDITWYDVCAIKITGLKDGWKFKGLGE